MFYLGQACEGEKYFPEDGSIKALFLFIRKGWKSEKVSPIPNEIKFRV